MIQCPNVFLFMALFSFLYKHFTLLMTPKAGLSMNGMWSHSHMPTYTSIYLGMLLLHMQINHTNISVSVLSDPFANNSPATSSWDTIVLYGIYLDIVFGSKHISVSDAQKPIFNFTLIIRHNIMVCDLESYAIAIRHCFDVRPPHVWCFL